MNWIFREKEMSGFKASFTNSNAGIVAAVVIFLTLALVAAAAPSQTKKTSKAKPAPTAKKNVKTAAATKKGAAKTETASKKTAGKSKTSDAKSAAKGKSESTRAGNKKQSAKTTGNKTTAKTADKKTTGKKTATAKTADKKSAAKSAARTAPRTVAGKKTVKAQPRTRKTTAKTNSDSEVKLKTSDTSANAGNLPQVIVTSLSVPVRTQAKASAATLTSARLGSVLKVTEKNPAWYKVQFLSGGKTSTGWVSANEVNDLNSSGKETIYRQIVERNYKPDMDFASASELYEFISGVDGEFSLSDASADIELKRLLALRAALRKISVDKKNSTPYSEFLKAHEKEVAYNEPAGEYVVPSQLFWDLQKKYQKAEIGDAIAWEGAQNPIPGECEGYVNCHLFYIRMTRGEYLRLYPAGKHAPEALKTLTSMLDPIVADLPHKSVYTGPSDVTDRADFNNLIAELRTIVSRLPSTEKEKPLQQLKQIAEAFR
jgi:Bacterial SH3 domain